MDVLAELGRTLGFTFAAGINLYATVAIMGLASRFGWVSLPAQYEAFASPWVIGIAIVLYGIEFLADKIPWVDSAWDAAHSFFRPIGGAAIAVISLAPDTPALTAAAALAGGLVAGSTHVTKAGTRVMVNTSPEPFSNWALSLGEDAFVVALGLVALQYPLAALGVTLVLLGVIGLFAAAIVRAFRRRFGRRGGPTPGPLAAGAMTAILVATGLAAVSGQAPPAAGAQQPPVFRGGANFVRVDAYATKDGEAVTDMGAEDFEILEDGVPQKVETFEHVRISTGGVPAARVEPRSILESRQMAGDPRARVFVIFIDTWHMLQGSGYNVRRPLVNLLQRVIGDEDLVAVMRPQMSARDIMFTRRTDHLAAMLQNVLPLSLGQRDRQTTDDPVEQEYEQCYPPESMSGGRRSPTAQAMIDRRREKQSLDALLDLVRHLDGLREERKAILLVSEGYLLYRDDRSLAERGVPTMPGIGVGPTGRLGTTDRNNPYAGMRSRCDADRVMLAQLDNWTRFRELLAEANRANATFYPVDPQGLPVFDSDMSNPLPLDVDFARVKGRLDSLQLAAINTDGVAVINSNDIDGGLKRVVADLTSYYLLGYSSTNTRLDGRFRTIRVRSKRPGVEIRARRGYQAATEAEVAARAAAAAPRVVDESVAAVERAVAGLAGLRTNVPLRIQVSAGWWTAPGSAAGQAAGPEPALWIYGNIDVRRPGGDDWSKGGEAEIAIVSEKGATITTFTTPVAPATGAFATRFPRNDEDVWLDPGSYAVRVRVKAAAGGLPMLDTARFDVPMADGGAGLALGSPVYIKRGQATGNREVLTADVQFRRTDRLIVDVSATAKPDRVSAELLDRTGRGLAVPVTAELVDKDGVMWVRSDVLLNALASGDYVIRVSAVLGGSTRQVLAPFRVVP